MNEPRVLLLGGNSGRWSASEKASDASTMNGIEAWVFAFGGDYIEGVTAKASDIAGYDIVIGNYNGSVPDHLLRLSEKRNSKTKWVTLIEGDALDYLKPTFHTRNLFDASDLVGCINKYSLDFLRRLTTARVEYIGIPYPAEGIRALSTPVSERRREIFLAPMLLARWLEYFCVKDLGVPFYGYEKRLSRKGKTLLKTYRKHGSLDPMHFHNQANSLYNDPSLTIRREEYLSNFFRHTGGSWLWINLDQRYTWGRYVLDAAALQVPIVTTRSTGHAEKFFPKTMLEHEFETEKAIEVVKRLLSDNDFYEEVATVPIEMFDEFRPEVKKNELVKLLFG